MHTLSGHQLVRDRVLVSARLTDLVKTSLIGEDGDVTVIARAAYREAILAVKLIEPP